MGLLKLNVRDDLGQPGLHFIGMPSSRFVILVPRPLLRARHTDEVWSYAFYTLIVFCNPGPQGPYIGYRRVFAAEHYQSDVHDKTDLTKLRHLRRKVNVATQRMVKKQSALPTG